MHIGIIDFLFRKQDVTLAKSLAYCQQRVLAAEHAGYQRFWFGEHYGTPLMEGTSPLLMMANMGSSTRSMRLGTGALLLAYQNIEKLKTDLKVLSYQCMSGIDLGLGKAPGTSDRTLMAKLNYQSVSAEWHQILDDLSQWSAVHNEQLGIDGHVQLFPLTASLKSAAHSTGHEFCYAHFINPLSSVNTEKIPSNIKKVAFFVSTSEDEEELHLLKKLNHLILGEMEFDLGLPEIPKKRGLSSFQLTDQIKNKQDFYNAKSLVGNRESLKEKFKQLMNTYEVDELLLMPVHYDSELEIEMISTLGEIARELQTVKATV